MKRDLTNFDAAIHAVDSRLVILRYRALYRTPREFDALDAADRRCAIPLETFARQLDALAGAGVAVIDPGKLLAEAPPRPGVVLTFDGAQASHYQYALPLLIQRGLTAAFFASVDRVGAGSACNWAQLRDMAEHRMTIGSSGLSGTPFDALSPAAAAAEFEASRERLEEAVDRPVRHFAFPRGRYRRGQLTLGAAAGYRVFHGARIGAHRPASLVPGSVLNRVPVLPGLDTDEFIGYALAAPLHLLRGRLAAEGRRVARAASRAAAALLAPLAGCAGRGS